MEVNYSRLTPYECQSRELHKITEKVSYLLRSLVLKPLFFLASPQQPLLDKTCVYTATFICILYLKRTTIQNSEYFTRLLFTSLNSIYSVANVLNIYTLKLVKLQILVQHFQCWCYSYPTSTCLTLTPYECQSCECSNTFNKIGAVAKLKFQNLK